MSVMALFLSDKAASAEYSFGYHRAEVIGALASIMIVWVMTAILVYEAVERLVNPAAVDGMVMFWVSFLGIMMNLVLMRVLSGADSDGTRMGIAIRTASRTSRRRQRSRRRRPTSRPRTSTAISRSPRTPMGTSTR